MSQDDYDRLDGLLKRHFAEFSIEIIKLAAFCWFGAMAIAVIVVAALR